jgi:hypothetical protein
MLVSDARIRFSSLRPPLSATVLQQFKSKKEDPGNTVSPTTQQSLPDFPGHSLHPAPTPHHRVRTCAEGASRVARWYVFKPKIQIRVNFGGPCIRRCWYILGPLGPFYGLLVYFMDFWYILWLFCIFFPFLVFCAKKIWQPWVQVDVFSSLKRQRAKVQPGETLFAVRVTGLGETFDFWPIVYFKLFFFQNSKSSPIFGGYIFPR